MTAYLNVVKRNSGKRAEYRERLIAEIGLDHVEWLECDANHPDLLDKYKTIDDIKSEISRYRKLSKSS